uniref:DNA repair metallo-beta-lactamase domain-containing protein n=1 Tax=Kalanchoe fedtschenkoi TaxID=63787 RepID=A0A7N0TV00_KALFE
MPVELPKGLAFSVDTWSASSMKKRHHFLTHAHRDHSVGITSNSKFPIYCTTITRNLLLRHFPQLDEFLFVDLEVGQSVLVEDVDGDFRVTAFDANHCPGAVMFLFEGSFGSILHTGDCRLTPDCLSSLPDKYVGKKGRYPKSRLDFVFLDCTFGRCYFTMPSKKQAIRQVINCIWKHPEASVVYLTCDLLGHEEILATVSETFGSKIYVDEGTYPDCFHTLKLTAPDIITQDPTCRFHIFGAFPNLQERAEAKLSEARSSFQPEPLILRPSTQWYAHGGEFSDVITQIKPRIDEAIRDHNGIWHVCYSMHSSREELEWALQLLAPKHVISTTPGCWAMDLYYVKNNCLSSKLASDDALMKLLQISIENSSSELVSNTVEHSILVEDLTQASEKSHVNSVPKKRLLTISPPSKRSITLFGRARVGVMEEFKLNTKKAKCSGSKELTVNYIKQDASLSQLEKTVEKNKHVESSIQNSPAEHDVIGETEKSSEALSEMDLPVRPFEKLAHAEITLSTSNNITAIGSSKCFSESLRKLYRSRNLPIPRILPSLVDLMNATNKKFKRKPNGESFL